MLPGLSAVAVPTKSEQRETSDERRQIRRRGEADMRQLGWADTRQQAGFVCTACRWCYEIPAGVQELPLEQIAQAFWAHDCRRFPFASRSTPAPAVRAARSPQELETDTAAGARVSTCNKKRAARPCRRSLVPRHAS